MNFIDTLKQFDLEEKEFNELMQKNCGLSPPDYFRLTPMPDWICSAFMWNRTNKIQQWYNAHQLWLKNLSITPNKTI